MTWQAIATVTPEDAPFTVWIEPWQQPNWGTIEYDCYLDTTGQVLDANGDPLANVTHWCAS